MKEKYEIYNDMPLVEKYLIYVLLGIAIIILVVSIVQSFQISTLKNKSSTAGGSADRGAIDMSGWTEQEKMEYEHHGIFPSRTQNSQSRAQSPTMVGGC